MNTQTKIAEDRIFKCSLGAYTNGKLYAVPYQNSELKLVWDVMVIKKMEDYTSETIRVKVVADNALKASSLAIKNWDSIQEENQKLSSLKRHISRDKKEELINES